MFNVEVAESKSICIDIFFKKSKIIHQDPSRSIKIHQDPLDLAQHILTQICLQNPFQDSLTPPHKTI